MTGLLQWIRRPIQQKRNNNKSLLKERNYDPTKEHIKKIRKLSEKWFRKK